MSDTQRTILVVDDDADVLLLASSYLAELGYTVLEARNGNDGLRILEKRADIDLLFTDIVMPGGMDGFELARRAAAQRPSLRVLYTSGFAREISPAHVREPQGRWLPKPWRRDALKLEVERAFEP